MMSDILYHCSFLETNVPLLVLIEAAKAGNEKEVEEYALVFTEHANKLVEVRIILIFSP
jgi:catenin alpha